MIREILKRDGTVQPFDIEKITNAIFKAAVAVGGEDRGTAEKLSLEVVKNLEEQFGDHRPQVEDVQDAVEKVLIENGHAKTAKAFILYREKRRGARQINALIGATIDMFGNYLKEDDWAIQENANIQKSVNGLNNYIRESFTKKYWLYEIYPVDVRNAHESGDIHLHDLGFFGPY